jgi:hypothetical protein
MEALFAQGLYQDFSASKFEICVLQFVFVKELRRVCAVGTIRKAILFLKALVASFAAESCYSWSKQWFFAVIILKTKAQGSQLVAQFQSKVE